MSFVHPLLLGGLLLVGIPVLIHLIMQQKPKRLRFPALRFLQQRLCHELAPAAAAARGVARTAHVPDRPGLPGAGPAEAVERKVQHQQ